MLRVEMSSNILCHTRCSKVYRGSIFDCGLLVARDMNELFLPELVTGKFGSALTV